MTVKSILFSRAGFSTLRQCRLCMRVAMVVFAAIFFIEGAILIPSVNNFERDMLMRLETEGFQTVASVFRLADAKVSSSAILKASIRQMENSKLRGGELYDSDGKFIGAFGEPLNKPNSSINLQSTMRMLEVSNGERYEITWTPKEFGKPYFMTARLDASWISGELVSFIVRISGLVLLIAVFVSSVTTIIVGILVITPVLALRKNLMAAGEDPVNAEQHILKPKRRDELGDVTDAFNAMIRRVSSGIKSLEEKEEELINSQRAAEKANQEKSSFLAKMSHELRTPLNAIIGFSEIITTQIMGPIGNDKYVGYAEDINASGSHLLGLINDILDLSKAEAGKLELNEERLNLGDIAAACVKMIETSARQKDISLNVNVSDKLPDLRADEQRLRQMLPNLLSNAVKFTPAGGSVTLDIKLNRTGDMEVMVSDTGIGIAADKIDQVMEEFSRIENAETKSIEGTGLGLPLTKLLAEIHDGRLTLASEPGAGTSACIFFPAARVLTDAAHLVVVGDQG